MKHLQYRNAGILLAGMMSAGALQAQAIKGQEAAKSDAPIPAITDWSSRTLLIRQPQTPDELATAGRKQDVDKLYRDPRYVASLLRRIEAEMPQLRTAPLAHSVVANANSAPCRRGRDRKRCDDVPPPNDGDVQRDWSHTLGATASGKMGMLPAKYNFDIFAPASCADDFVVYGTNTGASGTQASIVSFNQLYQGTCNGPWNNNGSIKAPNVMWAYNTGTGYITETSPVLSYLDNGKQVAYVQRNTTTGALQLVLLKWLAGQGTPGAPVALTVSANAAAYRSCTSNCYFVIPFSGTSNRDNIPTFSSPFVDYYADVLWAGDGNGRLHKFTGVFVGQPAEVTSGGFPAVVEAGMSLSPPVATGDSVYVGSQSGSGAVGGKLHRVNASTGQLFSSPKLAVVESTGIRESVIVDNLTNSVFAFLFNDGTVGDGSNCEPTDPGAGNFDACRVVTRFATGFANNAAPLQRAYVGRGNSRVSTLYAGGFDDDYYNSTDGTGAMYIVGGQGGTTYLPSLWKVPLTAGAMGTAVQGAQVGDNVPACVAQPVCSNSVLDISAVTVIKNPSTGLEHLFFSMPRDATASGCTGACVYMYPLNQQVTVVGSSETWTLRIAPGSFDFGTFSYPGMPSSGAGSINLEGTILTAGTHFSTSGNRSDDRTALVNAIDALSGYNAATSGSCTGNNTACDLIITRVAQGNVAPGTVTESLTNVSQTGNVDGATGGTYMQDIAWSTGNTPGASLPVTGGTGGIIIDNVRPTAETGTSQVYFAQLDTAVLERWTMTFTTDEAAGSFIVNGVTFNGGVTTSCNGAGGTFDMSGTVKADAIALRACLLQAALPGFTISGESGETTGSVVVTYTQKGNATDTLVTEAISGTGNSISITQGTASTAGNAIQASQSGLL